MVCMQQNGAARAVGVPEGGFFSSDRAAKYGWGMPRLALLTLAAFELAPRLSPGVVSAGEVGSLGLAAYAISGRWLLHAWLGSIGAIVNVQVAGFSLNLVALAVAALLVAWDVRVDCTIAVVLAKTMGGDFLAGKLDTAEWKLVLLFTFGLLAPAVYLLDGLAVLAGYARLFPLLFIVQAFCEFGDNHLEHWTFFRHRYSFEAFTMAVLALGLSPTELRVVQHDLVVCLFYRISNLSIIIARSSSFAACLEALSLQTRKACFAVFGVLRGAPLRVVSDVDTAMAVLRASRVKGDALERFVATPAWSPVLSLESIDGPLYEAMIRDFHALLRKIPPTERLQEGARRAVQELKASGHPIDANAVARLSLQVFLEYLLGKAPGPADLDTLVAASWEWRKEVAVRGKADEALKQAAVKTVVKLLRGSEALWSVHGDLWAEPRYYSLLMQPFVLSPAINVGDIAVAMKEHEDLPLEAAMRLMHPFPILERLVEKDVVVRGKVAVRAGTQVIMFTSDFKGSSTQWPVFGGGPRACAGTHLALPFLKLIREELLHLPQFLPEQGHKYSGRNNDGNISLREAAYFAQTVLPVVLRLGSRSTTEDLERHLSPSCCARSPKSETPSPVSSPRSDVSDKGHFD